MMPGRSKPQAPSFVGNGRGARHSAFGTRSLLSERVLQQHAMVLGAIAQAQGRALNAIDINQYLQGLGTPLQPYALYRALKHLTEDGRLLHGWSERNGRASAAYRLAAGAHAAPARLVCRCCGDAVELQPHSALARWMAEACDTHGMTPCAQGIDIQVLCRACCPPHTPQV